MSSWKWTLPAALLLVAGVGVGYWYLSQPVAKPIPPEIAKPITQSKLDVPKVAFADVTAAAGITFRHVNGSVGKKLLPETMGGGVAVIDFDNDGKQDLLFINSCPWPGHSTMPRSTPVLHRNRGDGTFEDVTVKCGLDVEMYGMGVAVGDYDNDGFPDLFISCIGKHHLFHNDGGKGFRDVTLEAAVGGHADLPNCSWEEFLKWDKPIPFGSSCTFVDYDGDGLLDLFVCHYVNWSPKADLGVSTTLGGVSRAYVGPAEFDGSQCSLYRNIDGKRFEDVSVAAGVLVTSLDGTGPKAKARAMGKSLGVVVCDPDEDGWPDLMVSNDKVRNFFFHNVSAPDGTRVFREMADDVSASYADAGVVRAGMGIDWGEYAPGKSAILIANYAQESNTFLRVSNKRPLRFNDAALGVGLLGPSRGPLKFGAIFLDYDNDSRLDLLTCNGHIEPDITKIVGGQTFEQPTQLFWNTGEATRTFEPVEAGSNSETLFRPLVGRGVATVDFDNDGDADIVLVGNGGPARLLRNDQALGHHYIRLTLNGDGKRSNRSAIGATITVEAGDRTIHRQVAGARGYLSQSEFPVTIGLGKATKIDKITVRWPGKASTEPQVWTNLAPDRSWTLTHGEAAVK